MSLLATNFDTHSMLDSSHFRRRNNLRLLCGSRSIRVGLWILRLAPFRGVDNVISVRNKITVPTFRDSCCQTRQHFVRNTPYMAPSSRCVPQPNLCLPGQTNCLVLHVTRMPRTLLRMDAVVPLDDLPVVGETVPAELVGAIYTCKPEEDSQRSHFGSFHSGNQEPPRQEMLWLLRPHTALQPQQNSCRHFIPGRTRSISAPTGWRRI